MRQSCAPNPVKPSGSAPQFNISERDYFMQKFVLISCALAALTACNSNSPTVANNSAGTISDADAAKEIASEGAMPMQAGEWEETASFNQLDAPGHSAKALAAMKDDMLMGEVSKTCWSKEDAAKPNAAFFGGGGGPSGCTITEIDRSGNNVKWAFVCKTGSSTISGKMNGSFAKDSYALVVDQTIAGAPEGAVRMQGKIESKRIGDCPT
jgi:Protein of unknown function (DUF3617)